MPLTILSSALKLLDQAQLFDLDDLYTALRQVEDQRKQAFPPQTT